LEARSKPEPVPASGWGERLRALVLEFRAESDPVRRNRVLSELWVLANLVLQKYVRAVASTLGGVDPDEVRDIAAEKALDLVGRLDREDWSLDDYAPAQVGSFLAKMARNGVVDRLRRQSREMPLTIREDGSMTVHPAVTTPVPGSEAAVLGPEYARAILRCFADFTERARIVWFLRVFYELSSAEIARHPRVATSPAAVDTMLLRCREHLRRCMKSHGLDPTQIPAGTFTALWNVIGREPAGP